MKDNILFPKTIEKFYSEKQKESLVTQKAKIQDQIDKSPSSSNSRRRERSNSKINIKEKLKKQQKNAIAEERDELTLTVRSSLN